MNRFANKMPKGKKILASTIVGAAVLLAGANISADAVLDNKVISLIDQSIEQLSKPFTAKANPDMAILLEQKKEDINAYVESRVDEVLRELSEYHDEESRLAKETIETHYNELIQAAETEFTVETEKIKQDIQANFASDVTSIKSSLEAQLEQALQAKFDSLEK